MKYCLLPLLLCTFLTNGGFCMDRKHTGNDSLARPGGIIFFSSRDLKAVKGFYEEKLGCELWLDQGSCLIFRKNNLLFGFCKGEKRDTGTIITFFFQTKEEVDRMYARYRPIAGEEPAENERFRIYHFFAEDPEGRKVEFQTFLHPVDWEF